MDSATKVCTKCGARKPTVSFAPRAGALDGRRGVCRACKTSGHQEWRDTNREHVRAKGRETMRKLYAANPAKFIERSRSVYAADPEKHQGISSRWKDENRAHVNAYSRQYRVEHLLVVSARLAEWRAANPDASRRYARTGRNRLSDSYVAKALVARRADVPHELIDLKREQLTIYRISKQIKSQLKEAAK